MSSRFYPVAEPCLDESDRKSLLAAFDSGWISSQGEFLERFEREFAAFCGVRHAMACANGTVALHLALRGLGVETGDEVLVPTFTYVATANAVRYCGADPVLVDCEEDTWNLDPAGLEAAITPRTRGILPVHLYGHPCEMDAITAVAERHGLWVLEDAAEAHGAEYGGRRTGSLGRAGTFSLYGNKIITTGEGGLVTTDDEEFAARVRLYRGQGMELSRRYWFPVLGYNYRMTNLAAALGCSQLAKIGFLIERHRQLAAWYREELRGIPGLALAVERSGVKNVHWMFCVRLRAAENRPQLRDRLMELLRQDGIDTRPFFYPMHAMPVYARKGPFPVADRIASSGINLPSSPQLERSDVAFIAGRLKAHAEALSPAAAPA